MEVLMNKIDTKYTNNTSLNELIDMIYIIDKDNIKIEFKNI